MKTRKSSFPGRFNGCYARCLAWGVFVFLLVKQGVSARFVSKNQKKPKKKPGGSFKNQVHS
jgi:hypothetical protein